jgi:hypothetical protein
MKLKTLPVPIFLIFYVELRTLMVELELTIIPMTPKASNIEVRRLATKYSGGSMTKYLETLNPFLLKNTISKKLKRIFSLGSPG